MQRLFAQSHIQRIPFFILFEIGTGIFEEGLFRGIILIPMLLRWGNSAKGRLISVFISSILFGFVHFSGGVDQIIFATYMGICFASAYVYSKNLISCMVFHALWNFTIKMPGLLNASPSVYIGAFWIFVNVVGSIIMLAMPVYAIILIIRSKPFSLNCIKADEGERALI